MTYGYLRVSTDQQDENNQRMGVDEKASRMGLKIDEYIIDHGVSGTKEPEKRELGALMKKLKNNDLIIASELSRLGRSMYMVMRILEFCMKNGIKVITVKDNYELVDNIQSKVLAFAFSLAAEIERDMISRRTKEALARCKLNGIKLGRKPGKATKVKLTGHEEEIHEMLKQGLSKKEIGERFGVHRQTVRIFIKEKNIPDISRTGESESPLKRERLLKLDGQYEKIKKLREEGYTIKELTHLLDVSHTCLEKFLSENNISKNKKRTIELNSKYEMIKELRNEGQTFLEISKKTGFHKEVVRRFCIRNKISVTGHKKLRRKSKLKEQIETIKTLRRERKPYKEIGKLFGVTGEAVRFFCKDNDIEKGKRAYASLNTEAVQ